MSMPIIMQDEEQAMVDKSLGSCLELKYNIMDGTENIPRFKRKNYHLNKLTCNNKVSFIMNDTTTSCCNVGYWPNPNGPSGNSVICSYCGRTINNWFQNYKQRIMLLTYRSLKVNENGNLVMIEMFQNYGVNESTKIIFSHSIRVFHVFNPKRGLLYNISYQDNKRLFFHTKKALFHYGSRGEGFLFSYFCKKLREKHLGFKLDLKDLIRVRAGESYKFFLLLRYPNLIPLMDKSVSDDTLLDDFFKIPYNKRKKLDSSLGSFSKAVIGYKSKVLLELMKIRFISRGAGDFPSLVITFKTLNILFGKDKALKLIQSKILSPIFDESWTEKINNLKEEIGCKRFFNLLMKEDRVAFNTLYDIANNVEIIKIQKPNYLLPRVNSVEELHRKTSRTVRKLKDKPIVFNYTKEEMEIFNQEVDGVVFKLVKSSNRLKSASTLLNNCLYGYRDQITTKNYYMILIYKDRVLLGATSLHHKNVVTQCKLKENIQVNKDRRLNEICKKYFKKTGCVYDRCMDLKHDKDEDDWF